MRMSQTPKQIDTINLDSCPRNTTTRLWLNLAHDALGEPIALPIAVVRGKLAGPTVGITAALHGDEVNGLPVIHRLMQTIDMNKLRGTLLCVLVVNVPAFKRNARFIGRMDINRVWPGLPNGNFNEAYAHRFVEQVLSKCDYLIDLHTASFGRINSLYVRANMRDPVCAKMAHLQRPQIILHNPSSDLTLRGTAMELGIPSITIEIGNPQVFQPQYIRWTMSGIRRILVHLNMLPKRKLAPVPDPIICQSSQWLFTDHGGLLTVLPNVTDKVQKGACIARQTNIFGDLVREYHAPRDGVVIGKSTNPVGQTGTRILHFGVFETAS